MCLDRVTKHYKPALKEKRFGFKIYGPPSRGRVNEGTLSATGWNIAKDEYNKPVSAKNPHPGYSYDNSHGFYVLTDEKAMRTYWVDLNQNQYIYIVEYTDIIATGRDSGAIVDIALKMRIVKLVNTPKKNDYTPAIMKYRIQMVPKVVKCA